MAAIYASKHAKTPEILVAGSHFLQFLACKSHSFPPRVLKLGQNQDIGQRIKIYYYHFLIRLQLCLKTGHISKVASRIYDIFCFLVCVGHIFNPRALKLGWSVDIFGRGTTSITDIFGSDHSKTLKMPLPSYIPVHFQYSISLASRKVLLNSSNLVLQ